MVWDVIEIGYWYIYEYGWILIIKWENNVLYLVIDKEIVNIFCIIFSKLVINSDFKLVRNINNKI